MMRIFSFSFLLLSFNLFACDSGSEASASASASAKAKPAESVQVSKEGNKIDPPVQVEKIPEGAWYCDMGTVHYARSEEGDGKCGLCGMKLKHKAEKK